MSRGSRVDACRPDIVGVVWSCVVEGEKERAVRGRFVCDVIKDFRAQRR